MKIILVHLFFEYTFQSQVYLELEYFLQWLLFKNCTEMLTKKSLQSDTSIIIVPKIELTYVLKIARN